MSTTCYCGNPKCLVTEWSEEQCLADLKYKTAYELRKRLGFKELSKEQQEENLDQTLEDIND